MVFRDTPAERGGETPIGDGRKAPSRRRPKLKERFIKKKAQYMRNYGDGIGLTWKLPLKRRINSSRELLPQSFDLL